MLDHVIYLYGFNLQYAQMLVKDVSSDQITQQPGGVINHPAWSLGHLVVSADHLGQLVELDSDLPDGWDKTFATGGVPIADRSAYPSKDELLDALKAAHTRNTEAVKKFDTAKLAVEHPNEKTRQYFPTVGDMVVFMMTGHEMDHLGQIAAWRRAMGLGSATGGA